MSTLENPNLYKEKWGLHGYTLFFLFFFSFFGSNTCIGNSNEHPQSMFSSKNKENITDYQLKNDILSNSMEHYMAKICYLNDNTCSLRKGKFVYYFHKCSWNLTLKAPRKILEQTTINFYFLFFKENNAWHFMQIVCKADDSHVMSSIISSGKYE